jgi:ribosomal protein S18 acetylase RimI-like enzyme
VQAHRIPTNSSDGRTFSSDGRTFTGDLVTEGLSRCRIRPAEADDAELLIDVLAAAVNWDPVRRALSRSEILARRDLAHYVDAWPLPGDRGVIAVWQDATPVGAAWLRRFTAADPSYGFVDDATPELSVGVLDEHRGRGIGGMLCAELLGVADAAGIPRVSLSVEKSNRAVSLYRRLTFETLRDDGEAITMVRTRVQRSEDDVRLR